MELLLPIATFAAGLALGFAGYRYYLKRDPERLEKWARTIRLARESASKRF